MKKITGLFIVGLLFMNALVAMAQTALKLTLKKGDKFYAEHSINSIRKMKTPDGEMEMPDENIVGITYEVLSENSGANDIKMTFSSIKFKAKSPMSGEETAFDSQKKEDLDGDMGVKVKKALGQSYVFTIDANSRKITSIKERVKIETDNEPPMGPMPDFKIFPQTDTLLLKSVEEIFGGNIPGNASPATGYSWKLSDQIDKDGVKNISTISYKIDAIQDAKINVSLTEKNSVAGTFSQQGQEIKISGSGSGTGSEVIDATTGLLIEKKSIVTSSIDMEAEMGAQKMDMTTTKNISVKKI